MKTDCNNCKYFIPFKEFNNPPECNHKINKMLLYFNIPDCEYFEEK
jgi:hypothetical protein